MEKAVAKSNLIQFNWVSFVMKWKWVFPPRTSQGELENVHETEIGLVLI